MLFQIMTSALYAIDDAGAAQMSHLMASSSELSRPMLLGWRSALTTRINLKRNPNNVVKFNFRNSKLSPSLDNSRYIVHEL